MEKSLGPGRRAQTSAEQKKGEHGIPKPLPTAMASSHGSRPRPQPSLLCPQYSPCHVPTSQVALTVPRCTCHLHAPAPTSSHQPPHPSQLEHYWMLQGVGSRPEKPTCFYFWGCARETERDRENACTRNVYTALMKGTVYAENSTQQAGSGPC